MYMQKLAGCVAIDRNMMKITEDYRFPTFKSTFNIITNDLDPNVSVIKVGEIFSEAGAAFSRLGELTMQLHPVSEPSPSSGKWTDEELEMLRTSVKRFGEDLHKISDVIKTRTVNQIRSALKRKVGEDSEKRKHAHQMTPVTAKVPVTTVDSSASLSAEEPPLKKPKTEVTLNMLNSTETPTGDSLVDIEGLEDASPMKKIDFGLAEGAATEQDEITLDSSALMTANTEIEALQR